MHSEGILAGELKHGPLALVDKLMPVIMIIMRDHTYAKCQNALQQVIARQVRAWQGLQCIRSDAFNRRAVHRHPDCSLQCHCPHNKYCGHFKSKFCSNCRSLAWSV